MLGAICGDVLGSSYEFKKVKYNDPLNINLCLETDTFTDDTALTLAVADWLLNDVNDKNYYNDDALKLALGKQFVKYSFHTFQKNEGSLSFGTSYYQWCAKADLIQEFTPYNSFGNGSAMRVSPIGWFFDTMEEVLRFAKLSADVTHNHSEGQKGAMCIAGAVFLARKGKTKEKIKNYLLRKFGYGLLNKTINELREECLWSDICQDTVPMAIVAFLESEDYESAIKNAISYGSDSDTIAAMAGSIAEAYYGGVPEYIKSFCLSKIPKKQKDIINEFLHAKFSIL